MQFHVNGGTTSGGSGPPSRDASPDARNLRRKERLDESTPQQRAQRAEYFRLLEERRKQRGLPSFSGMRRA